MKPHFQLSLRELLFVVLFAAIGLASLRAGGVVGSILVMLAIVVTMCFAIVAFVGRASIQALAIGFLTPVIAYAAIVLAVGMSELDPYGGKLPTSKLLRPMFELIVKRTWTNANTGQVVPDYDPATDANRPAAGGGGFMSGGGFFSSTVSPMMMSESPDRTTFMSLGHLLFAMMFGYAGSKFAVAVHHKQRVLRPGRDEAAA